MWCLFDPTPSGWCKTDTHSTDFGPRIQTNTLNQEERVWQLEEYMKVIVGDFMQLSSEVTRRLKEKLKEKVIRVKKIEKITKYLDIQVPGPLVGHKSLKNPAKKAFPNNLNSIPKGPLCIRYVHLVLSIPPLFQKSTFGFKPKIKGQSSSSQEVSLEEEVQRLRVFKNGVHQMYYDALTRRRIHPGDIIDWEFLASQGLDQAFFEYDPNHLGVWFRPGGEQKEISLLELGWRVGLYSKKQSKESMTLKVEEEDDKASKAAGGDASNEGAGGSTEMYRNISQEELQYSARFVHNLKIFPR
nr:hypothetical protein [Tanacetum cinerariifolium]